MMAARLSVYPHEPTNCLTKVANDPETSAKISSESFNNFFAELVARFSILNKNIYAYVFLTTDDLV